jgi:Flp pilus assembly protein TadG
MNPSDPVAGMFRTFVRLIRETRGVAAIEMAFIMPFLLFLYFGLVDLTAMISINRKITYAASVVADLVTQNDTTFASTAIPDYVNAAELILRPTPIADTRVEIFQFHKDTTTGTISSQWRYKTTAGPTCSASIPSTTGMDTLMTDNNDLIVARVCLTYAPYIAGFLGKNILGATSFLMSEQIALRPRQSSTLACTGCPTS